MRRLLTCLASIGLTLPVLTITGCDHDDRDDEVKVRRERVGVEDDHDRTVVVERQPVVVEREPVVVEAEPSVVIVREAPPPVIVERVPRVSSGQIWIAGYYRHDGHRFVWVRGHVERARPGYRYETVRWVRTSRGYERHGGVWIRH